MNTYENLRFLMYKHGIKKADVIRATGVTRPVLVDWEKGRREPSLKTLRRLASYFGVDVAELLKGA